jgi:glycosyltransferase involved in cell wall biosynthesis
LTHNPPPSLAVGPIVLVAYACEPGIGSEAGAGWAWARLLAGIDSTVVVTRKSNAAAIQAELDQMGDRQGLEFIYVDLPKWARFWKKGNRGVRSYYLIWQVLAHRKIRQLGARPRLVWHLTLSTVWLGAIPPRSAVPFLYGPVGGGVPTAWRLLSALGLRGILSDLTREAVRLGGRYVNPLARWAPSRANLILTQNVQTRDWLPPKTRAKAIVLPHVIVEDNVLDRLPPSSPSKPKTALFAGRLLPWKGVALAIGALSHLPAWQLVICGTGPDERRLRKLAESTGAAGRVSFLGWQPREDLLARMRDASVFLFPSLHDEAGWVVLEACQNGLPVVCLDLGGPPELLRDGIAVDPSGGRRHVERALAKAVEETAAAPEVDRIQLLTPFTLSSRRKEITNLLQSIRIVEGGP